MGNTIIKFRAEEIVRQHRVEMLRRIDPEDVKKRLYDGDVGNTISCLGQADGLGHRIVSPPSGPDTLPGRRPPRPHFFNSPSPPLSLRGGWEALVRAVNWGVAFGWACKAVLAGCLIYLGIFVFGPFAVKLWK